MRSYVNNRVTGTDPRATWEGREQLRATELNVYDSPTIRWSQTIRGLRADVRPNPTPTPAPVTNGRPFQVYNIPNNSASPAQQTIYTDAAVAQGIPISIDDYTFQLRSGLVGCRSKLALPNNGGADFPLGDTYQGNFEEILYFPGTDFLGNLFQSGPGTNFSDGQFDDPLDQTAFPQFGSGYIPNAGDVLLSDFGSTVICGQIIVDPTPDAYGNAMASLWLDLHDVAAGDPVYSPGINIRLWGRRVYPLSIGFGQTSPFPTGDNIIPIAIFNRHVAAAADVRLPFTQIEQIQWGNLVNRYQPGVAIWRGLWTANNLANQVFYPNDEVFDDSAGSVGGNGWGRYTWIAAAPGFGVDAPHIDNANWVKTSN